MKRQVTVRFKIVGIYNIEADSLEEAQKIVQQAYDLGNLQMDDMRVHNEEFQIL